MVDVRFVSPFVRRIAASTFKSMALLSVALVTTHSAWSLQSQSPIQALKDAWKQAKQQQQQQQQQGQKPQQTQQKPGQGNGPQSIPTAQGGKKRQQSSAKVEPALMAASETGLKFYISNPGGHLAAVAHRGGRVVVLFDGTEGPKFDAIVGESPSDPQKMIKFSPDGNRYAYIGRSGNEDVIMVDGKEVLRYDEANTVLQAGQFNAETPAFTPNSKHFFFILHPNSTTGNESKKAHFYWDGVEGPMWADQALISPDGDHYTYYLRVPNPNGENDTLIIDGKPAGYLASMPQFTFDGKHVITQNSYSRPQPYQEVLLDGKPIMKTNGVQIYMPPATYNFLAVLGTGINGNDRFLVYGGKKVEGSECRGSSGYENITFSPDGKHWAARCQSRPGFHFAVVDGKKGLEYGDISQFSFTADGTVVYFATQGQQHYVVLGSDESEPYDNLGPAQSTTLGALPGPTVSGNHIGYISYTPGQGTFMMHVDGKSFSGKGVSNLQFSPDGKHFAFVRALPTGDTKLVIDGVDQPGTYHDMRVSSDSNKPSGFVFSPDSNHIAWWGMAPDQQSWGIFVDGKFMPESEPNIAPVHVSFTSDSKHIVYQAIVRTDPPSYPVFVDGRVTNTPVGFNNMLLQDDATWHHNDDGSLSMFGQDQDGIKRFRVTPADDTSVATITGGASAVAKNN